MTFSDGCGRCTVIALLRRFLELTRSCCLLLQERSRAANNHRGQLLTVMRPAKGPAAAPAAAAAADTISSTGSTDGTGLVPVQLPTGSVRVSLGYLSTFEDMHALLQFLHGTFRDEKGVQLLAAADSLLQWSADVYC
jgi:hypothetical protein